MDSVLATAKDIQDDIVDIRRNIHRHPELGTDLPHTAALVRSELEKYGVDEVISPTPTSVVGVIKGKKGPGKTVGLRCDMDALPVTEQTGLDFGSETEGKMHACGHDIHTSMMLGDARILCQMRDSFAGTVKVIFEPSEEQMPGGAKLIIESGAVDDVDAFFSMHVRPSEDEVGKIFLKKGPITTSADELFVTVKGQSGHGSEPHKSKDAILAACQLNVLFQQVLARNVDPLDTCIFTMNEIHGGINTHTIAGECKLTGSIRAYTPETREVAWNKFHDICRGVELISGCKIEDEVSVGYDACSNDDKLVDIITDAFDKNLGNDSYYMMKNPVGFSEDFSFFSTILGKPSVVMFLNAGHAEGHKVESLHTPKCTFNEEAMPYGIAAMTTCALAFLNA